MEQTKITEPTIFLGYACTANQFKEQMANVREVIMTLLIYSNTGYKVDAQMIGRCIDTLDVIDRMKIVED